MFPLLFISMEDMMKVPVRPQCLIVIDVRKKDLNKFKAVDVRKKGKKILLISTLENRNGISYKKILQ